MITDEITEEPSLPPRTEPGQADIAVRSTPRGLEHQARALIRQRPVVAVLAAAGVGYLVARLVSRVMR